MLKVAGLIVINFVCEFKLNSNLNRQALQSIYFTGKYVISECTGDPLGMEHGHIKDVDITASSTFDYHSVGPHIGR